MYMFPLLLVFVLVMARANSTYHPHLLFKRYIIIKNETIRKLLIGQHDLVNSRAKNTKSNRNKLTYSGIVFYVLFLVIFCFSLIMTFLPDFPCESFVVKTKHFTFTGNTLNEKLPFIFAVTLLFAETAFHFINTSKYAIEKTNAKKFIGVMYYFFFAMFSAGAIGGLLVAISIIVKAI